jgi:hypothetical protein
MASAGAAELTRTPVKGVHRVCPSPAWHIAESANFRVLQYGTESPSPQILEVCEKLRMELTAKWLGAASNPPWNPKCDIVLHGDDASYAKAVGPGADSTIASSLIDQQKGRIRQRRIDVRATDAQWHEAALPHEMTHVVISDRFIGRRLPRWADEGLAILADPAQKQDGHLRDFQRALAGQDTFRVVELLTLEDYPAAHRWAAFYGQSASLAQFLVRRGTPEQFVGFLQRSLDKGYETALRDTYRIAGVAELERAWSSDLNATRSASVSAPIQVTVSQANRRAASVFRLPAAQISVAPISWQIAEPAK